MSNGIGGNLAEAVRFFEEAVKQRPNEAFAYFNLGNAYYNFGDAEKGQINHQKAIQIDPSFQEKVRK